MMMLVIALAMVMVALMMISTRPLFASNRSFGQSGKTASLAASSSLQPILLRKNAKSMFSVIQRCILSLLFKPEKFCRYNAICYFQTFMLGKHFSEGNLFETLLMVLFDSDKKNATTAAENKRS